MKQECSLFTIGLTWLGLPALAIFFALTRGWESGVVVLVVGILGQIAYQRKFPTMSRAIGYGSVADVPAKGSKRKGQPQQVTLYTANVCPFCPIVRQRLTDLKDKLNIEIKEIDVTFRPQLLTSKGFRSVPVIEANGKSWVGNATSAQLAELISAPVSA